MKISVLHIKEGIPISYNNSESNIETVFGYNSENHLIPTFTFNCSIHPNMDPLTQSSSSKTIEAGFLFYSFQYQVSYTHFLTQTLPKLREYMEKYKNTHKLLIPELYYNELTKNILQLLNISIDNIYILKPNVYYTVHNFQRGNSFECLPSPFSDSHLWIYRQIRSSLNVKINTMPYRKIYIKRDGSVNTKYGNSEIGILRKIGNEHELLCELEKRGFEIVTLGTKSLEEKYRLLADALVIITPLGANCSNLLFTNAPKYLLCLSNDRPLGFEWFHSISEALNAQKIMATLFTFPPYEKSDPKNQWNDSYNVDIPKILEYICNLEIL